MRTIKKYVTQFYNERRGWVDLRETTRIRDAERNFKEASQGFHSDVLIRNVLRTERPIRTSGFIPAPLTEDGRMPE